MCLNEWLLQGYPNKEHAYIASQGESESYISHSHMMYIHIPSLSCGAGPTELTVVRFWQMIWEHQLPTIVMLTRCIEDGKVR